MRLIKTLLVFSFSLFCLIYAAQNLVNLEAAHAFIAYIASMPEHAAYPEHIGPAITSSALVWVMVLTIISAELAAGGLALWGAWRMWQTRNAGPDAFNAAKHSGLIAYGIGLLLWFGIFHAVGGAYFQMWQIEAGRGPFDNSAAFVTMIGIIFMIVQAPDS